MGIPVLILGESGSGKSASMRNMQPDSVGVFNVANKLLPFRNGRNFKMMTVTAEDKEKFGLTAGYVKMAKALRANKLKRYVIDDSQYMMSFEFFDRTGETGFQKFTDIGVHFKELVTAAQETSPDTIVYFMHHIETDSKGKQKAKTIGKMLDEKLTLEGMFTIVLLCKADNGRHFFVTQSDGTNTAKSPMDMFEPEIDNDLEAVDKAIREYYGLGE